VISVKPFEKRHLLEASQMFATKYRALQQENELLPASFRDEAVIEGMLARMIREHPGAVAIERKRVVGYLTGYSRIPALKGGASGVYVPVWGHCVETPNDIVAVYAALYSQMSEEWVASQCYTQLLTYFIPDGDLEALLFGLGFGLLLIDGIRAISPVEVRRENDIEIQEAGESELTGLMQLNHQLDRHLRGAPIFLNAALGEDDLEKIRSKFLSEGKKAFIAKRDEEVISGIRGELNKGPGCDLFDVEGSLGINFAYTNAAIRAKGLATRLLNELMLWGSEQGMTRCVVDFEAANLVAKGFWLRHFRPICYSVIRRIDERI
jgi:GNAT superfamily N-acetyltransferase